MLIGALLSFALLAEPVAHKGAPVASAAAFAQGMSFLTVACLDEGWKDLRAGRQDEILGAMRRAATELSTGCRGLWPAELCERVHDVAAEVRELTGGTELQEILRPAARRLVTTFVAELSSMQEDQVDVEAVARAVLAVERLRALADGRPLRAGVTPVEVAESLAVVCSGAPPRGVWSCEGTAGPLSALHAEVARADPVAYDPQVLRFAARELLEAGNAL